MSEGTSDSVHCAVVSEPPACCVGRLVPAVETAPAEGLFLAGCSQPGAPLTGEGEASRWRRRVWPVRSPWDSSSSPPRPRASSLCDSLGPALLCASALSPSPRVSSVCLSLRPPPSYCSCSPPPPPPLLSYSLALLPLSLRPSPSASPPSCPPPRPHQKPRRRTWLSAPSGASQYESPDCCCGRRTAGSHWSCLALGRRSLAEQGEEETETRRRRGDGGGGRWRTES